MEASSFYQKVKSFIAQKHDLELERLVINENTHLVRQGLIDSFMIMEIILFIEQLTGKPVDIDNLAVSHIESLRAMYDYFIQGEQKLMASEARSEEFVSPNSTSLGHLACEEQESALYLGQIHRFCINASDFRNQEEFTPNTQMLIAATELKTVLKGFEAFRCCLSDILLKTSIPAEQIDLVLMVSASQNEFLADLNQYNAILHTYGLSKVEPIASFYPGVNYRSLEGLRLIKNYLLAEKTTHAILVVLDVPEQEDQPSTATGCLISRMQQQFRLLDIKQVTDYDLHGLSLADKLSLAMNNSVQLGISKSSFTDVAAGQDILWQLYQSEQNGEIAVGQTLSPLAIGDITLGTITVQKLRCN